MADDQSKQDNRDRSRVAGYEIQYLAEKPGITSAQARELIKRYGNGREILEKHARDLK